VLALPGGKAVKCLCKQYHNITARSKAMPDNKTPQNSKAAIKEKIRAKYRQGVEGIEVMEAAPDKGIFDDDKERYVAIYARVSTGDPRQVSSYEMQKSHYTDLVDRQKNWSLIELYADEGISGTSLKKRDAFNKMIEDCLSGKKGINLIVVKSVSRFARNVGDFSGAIKKLADLTPPIGVYFEMENLSSLNSNHEFSINVMASMAQDESRNKSSLMERSIEIRFRNGVFLTPELLGYDLDEDGNLAINGDEAKTVRLIFYMYLFGYTCAKIAEILTDLERTTKKGNTTWAAGSILQILQNERHCGDIVARKTFTRDYKEHVKRKNTINPETQKFHRNKYSKKDHHAPIISRDDFIAVQRLISNAKYGNKGFLPELKVIQDGALKGFVAVNPRWGAFRASDYTVAAASAEVDTDEKEIKPIEIEVQSGDFDMRNCEVVRSQFLNTAQRQCVSFSTENLWFSSECIRKLGNTDYVEVLVEPNKHLLAIRPSMKEVRNAVRWTKQENGKYISRMINGLAFLGTLYEIFGWNADYRYRVRGIRRQKEQDAVMVFDMRETEIFVPQAIFEQAAAENSTEGTLRPVTAVANRVAAFPNSWFGGFGANYYCLRQARELETIDAEGKWDITADGQVYRDGSSLNVTPPECLTENIKSIIDDIGRGGTVGGE
jgi:DNA invertase Pin-like site-specific DNA recombinase